jgi:hypothetical protein
MSIERPKLANAFAPTKNAPADRSEALRGLLPPARTLLKAAPEPPTEPQADTARTDPPAAPKNRTTTSTARRKAPNFEADEVGNVTCYIEPDVLAIARAEVRRQGSTYDQLLVEAFEDITDEQLRAHFVPENEKRAERGMPSRVRRVRGTAGIQVQFRMDGQQRAWLEQKAAAVNAPSRSALVATALRLHLAQQ